MNEPKIPDEATSWGSIDIYLFSNGQFNSPPRKYHLIWKELKDWDATTRFLAHSQYGSGVFNIVLYTLDGKKINSPLELHHEAAYVAVTCAEEFICSGYDKYLIKASRSWEKRQVRQSCNSAVMKPDEIKESDPQAEIIAMEMAEGVLAISPKMVLEKKDEDNLKQNSQSVLTHAQVPSGSVSKNITQKRNGKDVLNNDFVAKNRNLRSINSKKDQLNKKRNSLVMNKGEPNKQKKELNPRNDLATRLNDNHKTKDALKEKSQDERNNSKTNNQIKADGYGTFPLDVNDSHRNIIKSDSNITMYRNDEQYIPINFDENNIEPKQINNNFDNVQSPSKFQDTEIQGHNIDTAQDEKHINIFLNIKVNGFNNNTTTNDSLHKFESNTTLMSQKISKLNIDVVLCKGSKHFCDNMTNNMKPSFDNETKYIYTKNNTAHCVCANKLNTHVGSPHNKNHSKFECLLPIPEEQIHRYSEFKVQMNCKSVQTDSYTNFLQNLTAMSSREEEGNDKAQEGTIVRRNVDDDNDESVLQALHQHMNAVESKHKVDNFTQTEFVNTLLQAIHHEDGRYTFHLPPLSLLKQYNINEI